LGRSPGFSPGNEKSGSKSRTLLPQAGAQSKGRSDTCQAPKPQNNQQTTENKPHKKGINWQVNSPKLLFLK
jgi:hypothetical protein